MLTAQPNMSASAQSNANPRAEPTPSAAAQPSAPSETVRPVVAAKPVSNDALSERRAADEAAQARAAQDERARATAKPSEPLAVNAAWSGRVNMALMERLVELSQKQMRRAQDVAEQSSSTAAAKQRELQVRGAQLDAMRSATTRR